MFRYTNLYINTLSLFISIILFFFINFFISNVDSIISNSNLKIGFELNETNQNTNFNSEQNSNYDKNNNTEEEKEVSTQGMLWYLEIPSINLKAEIKEGTSKENLEYYIGHFEESAKMNGNIGLAAHNRGYTNNYFKDLKKLKEGDKVFYYYNGKNREYLVEGNFIIQDTDWSVLDASDENIITLITCVENEPNYRRCVQAKEINNK